MIKKSIKVKIKEYFYINPSEKLRVREIERALKIPLPSVIRYCNELEKENILKIIEIGNSRFYTASKNDQYKFDKKWYNIRKLYDFGLIEYIKTELSNPVIIVFGSYAKGEDVEESDIDLYIESPSKKKLNLEKFKKIFKREIQILQSKNITEIKNKNLANNIINGNILNNQIEVFK